MQRSARICLAASAGGHASQLMRLQSCWTGMDCFSVTTSAAVRRQWVRFGRVYIVEESNRQHPLKVLRTLVSCGRITLVERPAVIITTEAAFVISHAGMGSIMIALEHRKRLLVLPRLKRYGEVVNNHQVGCARRFAELGYLLAAYDTAELPLRLREMESFVPACRSSDADKVARRIAQFLAQVETGPGYRKWRTVGVSSG